MKNLEFKTTGDWNLQGNNKKEIYISLVAKINDWKKNIVFRKLMVGEKAFDFLLQHIIKDSEDFTNWEFSVSTKREFIHSIFATEEKMITW